MMVWRWFLKNMGSLLLALVLALLVWAAAVNEADPLATQEFPGTVTIEYTNVEEGFVLVGSLPQQGTMTLRTPTSVWEQLSESDVRLVVDMTGLQAGNHTVDVTPVVDVDMVRVVSYEPASLELTIQPSVSQRMGVNVELSGEPATGYSEEDPVATPDRATVEGPSSLMTQVEELRANVDVTGRSSEMSVDVEILPLDIAGRVIEGVTVTPATTTVQVSFVQLSGYRLVGVVPIIQVEPASGYRVGTITYTPTAVTVQAEDPQDIDLLPGYVETEPLVVTGARETIERTLLLSLPEGFTVIGDSQITLVVTIEPLETSITITRTLEIIGLDTGLAAEVSPDTVRVFLQGPQPTLEDLQEDDVVVVLDLDGLEPGVHQLEPLVLINLEDVEVQAVLPETIEVTITELATPTPGS